MKKSIKNRKINTKRKLSKRKHTKIQRYIKKGGSCVYNPTTGKFESKDNNQNCDPKEGVIYTGFPENNGNFGFLPRSPKTPQSPKVSSHLTHGMGGLKGIY